MMHVAFVLRMVIKLFLIDNKRMEKTKSYVAPEANVIDLKDRLMDIINVGGSNDPDSHEADFEETESIVEE